MTARDDVTADLIYWRTKLVHHLLVRDEAQKMLRRSNIGLRSDVIIAGMIFTDERLAAALIGLGGLAAEW